MDPTPTSAEGQGSTARSSVLGDLVAARAEAAGADSAPSPGAAGNEQPNELGPLLALGVVGGLIVFTIGALVALDSVIGAVVAVLSLALAIASTLGILRRRRVGTVGTLALAGCLGWVLLVVGLLLGIRSYDERFIYDNTNAFWEATGLLGPLMSVLGVLLVVSSIVGIVLVGVVRLVRPSAGA